ncbi:hypothetical protein HanIR_Chr17g0900671 [Helianthus annuus]|nr:hypothetical protein HanIR_Chr17g0900671 [Helianthus annuus]
MAMAEAAATAAAPCLMRSVSQPLFASREFKEGDPLRALTTSVSFGRFMNEPLDWERWSSFSHNRIREDVQKHSRPGAVAEKKAFFEAYFNRFASKKSAKPPKKENRPPNYSPQTHVSPVTISNNKENHPPTVATDENMRNKGAESGGQMEQEKTSTENVSSEKHCSDVKISNQSGHVDRKKRQIKDKKSGQTKTEISSVKTSSRKAPIPEIHPKNQIFKHNPMVSSVNAVKKNTQSLPKSENKRSRPLLDRLVNGNKTVVPKSNSTNHSDTSIASTKKPTSVTVPSSFSFKSDERAAKRKQFFQKLEEKPKLKENARTDDKKLRWSTAIEAKQSTVETRVPSNKLQKVQPTQTSQKLGTKPKNFIELNKKMLSSSMAFLRSRKSYDTRN